VENTTQPISLYYSETFWLTALVLLIEHSVIFNTDFEIILEIFPTFFSVSKLTFPPNTTKTNELSESSTIVNKVENNQLTPLTHQSKDTIQ
jgi:hypothetical protein